VTSSSRAAYSIMVPSLVRLDPRGGWGRGLPTAAPASSTASPPTPAASPATWRPTSVTFLLPSARSPRPGRCPSWPPPDGHPAPVSARNARVLPQRGPTTGAGRRSANRTVVAGKPAAAGSQRIFAVIFPVWPSRFINSAGQSKEPAHGRHVPSSDSRSRGRPGRSARGLRAVGVMMIETEVLPPGGAALLRQT
jgi:hypothetical protein